MEFYNSIQFHGIFIPWNSLEFPGIPQNSDTQTSNSSFDYFNSI